MSRFIDIRTTDHTYNPNKGVDPIEKMEVVCYEGQEWYLGATGTQDEEGFYGSLWSVDWGYMTENGWCPRQLTVKLPWECID